MSTVKDIIITSAIVIVCVFYIDKTIAGKIIKIFGSIAILDYQRCGTVALAVSIILVSVIAGVVYIIFGNLFGSEFINRFEYLILALAAFMGGIPLQIFFIQNKN